jgi:excisionase family DNA binding protein
MQMDNLTLETLPKAFTKLSSEISEIKRLLIERNNNDADRWMNLTELCEYLPDHPTKPTVYGWVHQNAIPCKKGGKHLRFLKSEIDAWLKKSHRRYDE